MKTPNDKISCFGISIYNDNFYSLPNHKILQNR